MPGREISCLKLINPHFAGVVIFICFNYFVYVYGFMLLLKPTIYIIGLTLFHVLFAMLLWSMGTAILSDPGRVPIYWGFFAEESDNKKRRYCLLCHSFKPQRCHHCSTCQRCVLNMDHHCPWISNCVGFNNRKFFMLFLFYIILTLIYCLSFEIPLLLKECIKITEHEAVFSPFTIFRAIGLLIQLTFLIVISTFFKFHVELVITNSSTLDNLQRQRNPNVGPNMYNVGTCENFQQVFGSKVWLWPFPIASSNGNGVTFPKNQKE